MCVEYFASKTLLIMGCCNIPFIVKQFVYTKQAENCKFSCYPGCAMTWIDWILVVVPTVLLLVYHFPFSSLKTKTWNGTSTRPDHCMHNFCLWEIIFPVILTHYMYHIKIVKIHRKHVEILHKSCIQHILVFTHQ